MDLIIRAATLDDAPFIHGIYSDSVLHGTASWELEPPDADEMRRRMGAVLEAGYPYFVAEHAGGIAGYTYASSYRPRPGYRFLVENSIYVHREHRQRGIARQLMTTLIDACTACGYRQMIAVIGDSENASSIELHRRLGFRQVGLLPSIGFKFGRWLDCVLMQRPLFDGDSGCPQEPQRFRPAP